MSSAQKYADISSFLKEGRNTWTLGKCRGGKIRPHLSVRNGDNVLVEPTKGHEKPITIKVDWASDGRVYGHISDIPWDSHDGDNWQGFSCGARVSVSPDRISAIFHDDAPSS